MHIIWVLLSANAVAFINGCASNLTFANAQRLWQVPPGLFEMFREDLRVRKNTGSSLRPSNNT
jgi:hypothetical protein